MNAASPLVRCVSTKQLVATVSRKANRDLAPRELRNEEGRNLGRIGKRLVVQSWEARNDRHRLFRSHVELGVLRTDVLRDKFRRFGFVVLAIVEADRECFDGPLAVGLHDCDDQR